MQCMNAVCTLVSQLQKKLLFISVMKQQLLVSLQMEVICFRKYIANETRNWIGSFILSCHTLTFPSSFVNSIALGSWLRHTGDAYVVSQWWFPSSIHVYWNTCKQNCLLSHCKKSCCGAATNFLLSPNSKLHLSVESIPLSLADDIQGEDFKSSQIMRVGDLQSLRTSTPFISWKCMTLICFLLESGTLHGVSMRSR